RRLDAENARQTREAVALGRDARGELGRAEQGDDLAGIAESLGKDRLLGDLAEIRGDLLAQGERHVARAEHAADALEGEGGGGGPRPRSECRARSAPARGSSPPAP